jgi:hypothetical protein
MKKLTINHDAKLPPLSTTMPTSSTHGLAREAEHADGKGSNIARVGGKPKVSAVSVHSGMHSRATDGNLVVGATQTTAALAADTSHPLYAPPKGKAFVGETVPSVPGQRGFQNAAKNRNRHPDDGSMAVSDSYEAAVSKMIVEEAMVLDASHPNRRK